MDVHSRWKCNDSSLLVNSVGLAILLATASYHLGWWCAVAIHACKLCRFLTQCRKLSEDDLEFMMLGLFCNILTWPPLYSHMVSTIFSHGLHYILTWSPLYSHMVSTIISHAWSLLQELLSEQQQHLELLKTQVSMLQVLQLQEHDAMRTDSLSKSM